MPAQDDKDHPKHFKELANNAFEFLTRSVDAIDPPTKDGAVDLRFSAMFFYQAVELLLKSRLLLEHWTLMLDDPRKSNITDFEKGKFRSVGTQAAANRIKSVLGEDVSDLMRQLGPVEDRRNQLVHFHAAHVPAANAGERMPYAGMLVDPHDEDKQARNAIAYEQFLVWHELHKILRGKWRDYFSEYMPKFKKLERRVRELQTFIDAKFESIKPEIATAIQEGAVFKECVRCGNESAKIDTIVDTVYEKNCLACRLTRREIEISCWEDDCEGMIFIQSDGFACCSECGAEFGIDELINRFEPVVDTSDPDSVSIYCCTSCESFGVADGTVVYFEPSSHYVCFSCLAVFDQNEMTSCEWCNHPLAGAADDTYLLGCPMCDGHHGWHLD